MVQIGEVGFWVSSYPMAFYERAISRKNAGEPGRGGT